MFRYYPVIDDWFLFLGNATYADKWNDVIIPNGMLQLRPLVGLTDIYVIGGILSGNLSIVYIFLTVMLGVAAFLYAVTLEDNGIKAGSAFLLVFAFVPISVEALYWVSAASRIIPVLFFIALSGFFINKYAKTNKNRWLLFFALSSGLSVCYYEAAIPLVVIYPLIILLLNKKSFKNYLHCLAPVLIPVACVVLIGVLYIVNSNTGEIAARGGLYRGNWLRQIGLAFSILYNYFIRINLKLSTNALKNGFNVILTDKAFIYLLLTLASTAVFGFAASKRELVPKKFNIAMLNPLLTGVILFGAGLVTNFLLDYVRFPLRVGFISFIGLGIIVQCIFDIIFIRTPVIKNTIISALIFLCIIAYTGELHDYKTTSETDIKIARGIIDSTQGARAASQDALVFLLGAKNTYLDENDLYYEHIKSAAESYASLTGCVRYLTGRSDINNIMSIGDGGKCSLYYKNKLNEVYVFYGLDDDFNVLELSAEADGGTITLRTEKGVYGNLIASGDEYGFIFIK